MPNLDEPAIRKVTASHFFFFKPGRRMTGVHGYMLVVMRIANIVHPGVSFSDGVERVVSPCRQRSIVGVYRSNPKDAGRGPMIVLHFQPPLILSFDQASSPG